MESQFDQITKVLAQATSRRHALRGIGSGLIGGVLATLGARKAWAQNEQVTICHVPPGNPNNVHTITVSSNAVPAHLRHGDAVCAPGNEDCCFNSGTSSAVCTNLETDASNCGVCGNACSNGQSCVAGVCEGCANPNACPGGPCGSGNCICLPTTEGGGACINPQFCNILQPCTSSADCPGGMVCTHSCCDPGFGPLCSFPCGTGPTSALATTAGPHQAGF